MLQPLSMYVAGDLVSVRSTIVSVVAYLQQLCGLRTQMNKSPNVSSLETNKLIVHQPSRVSFIHPQHKTSSELRQQL